MTRRERRTRGGQEQQHQLPAEVNEGGGLSCENLEKFIIVASLFKTFFTHAQCFENIGSWPT